MIAVRKSCWPQVAEKHILAILHYASCWLGRESQLCLFGSGFFFFGRGGSKGSTKPSQLVGSRNRRAALVVVIATSLLASHTALQWHTPSG